MSYSDRSLDSAADTSMAISGAPGNSIGPWEMLIIGIGAVVVIAVIVGVIVAVVASGKGRTTSTNVPPPPKTDQNSRDAPSQ